MSATRSRWVDRKPDSRWRHASATKVLKTSCAAISHVLFEAAFQTPCKRPMTTAVLIGQSLSQMPGCFEAQNEWQKRSEAPAGATNTWIWMVEEMLQTEMGRLEVRADCKGW